jgi:hypothetical protein
MRMGVKAMGVRVRTQQIFAQRGVRWITDSSSSSSGFDGLGFQNPFHADTDRRH